MVRSVLADIFDKLKNALWFGGYARALNIRDVRLVHRFYLGRGVHPESPRMRRAWIVVVWPRRQVLYAFWMAHIWMRCKSLNELPHQRSEATQFMRYSPQSWLRHHVSIIVAGEQ